jgi:diaminopimelate epimerase
MRARAFEKWEGLGNDFVVVRSDELAPSPELARRLCDRRRGIGADGVLFVSEAPARMIVLNADGSRPEMCGNGLRCVAGFLAGDGAEAELVVATDAGDKRCAVERAGDGEVVVTVAMGVARALPELAVDVDGRTYRFARIDVGNPHAVTFEDLDETSFDAFAPVVATTPAEGINVELCRLDRSSREPRIEVVVWERGVGRTLACGTGACAVAAAACDADLAPFDAPIRVALPGGELAITVAHGSRALTMRGPARRVFRGEVMA